jgi:hypothetical protein
MPSKTYLLEKLFDIEVVQKVLTWNIDNSYDLSIPNCRKEIKEMRNLLDSIEKELSKGDTIF